MDLQIEGTIKVVMDTEEFDSGFTKRAFVVETNEQYPQEVKLEFIKDKTAVLDSYHVGDSVNVHFNVRGNEYQGRYFVNLQAWKMNTLAAVAPASAPLPTPPPIAASNDDDDLPF